MARSAAGMLVWRQQTAIRRAALEPLRDALYDEGHTQAWLRVQLEKRVKIKLPAPTLNYYLNGYTRLPTHVLSAACWIAGVREADILARIDEAVLLQPKRTSANKRQTASA